MAAMASGLVLKVNLQKLHIKAQCRSQGEERGAGHCSHLTQMWEMRLLPATAQKEQPQRHADGHV